MHLSLEELKNDLKTQKINLSHQRLKVVEFLVQNRCHPTADCIYVELKKDIPTLSKTTIYNTLKILTDAGLVKEILIDGNEVRYDIGIDEHGHFKCQSCGKITDFGIDIGTLTHNGLDGYKINNKIVYFEGICLDCLCKHNL